MIDPWRGSANDYEYDYVAGDPVNNLDLGFEPLCREVADSLATRTATRDRTRSVRRRAHSIAAWLRRRNDDAKEEVRVITAEMAGIAEAAAAEARHLAINARRAGQAASGKAAALVAELERTAEAVERIAGQTRVRLAGVVPDGSTRVVSLHDPDARPIATGRLGRPVEFGYTGRGQHRRDRARPHRRGGQPG